MSESFPVEVFRSRDGYGWVVRTHAGQVARRSERALQDSWEAFTHAHNAEREYSESLRNKRKASFEAAVANLIARAA